MILSKFRVVSAWLGLVGASALLAGCPLSVNPLSAPSSGGVARGDFNGDGAGDLAIGVPNEDSSTNQNENSGVVIVIYGRGADGLGTSAVGTRPAVQILHQDIRNVDDIREVGDFFGAALASGDFNGDGFSDLAVGVPGERGPAGNRVGGVHVFNGSSTGIVPANDRLILANNSLTAAFPVFAPTGFSMVWADFNGDGVGDLAAEARDNVDNALAMVMFGSNPGGLSISGARLLNFGRNFGTLVSLGSVLDLVFAAGRINGDNRADLVVGSPFLKVGTASNAGAVHILYSAADGTGPSFSGSQTLTQNLQSPAEIAEAGDQFGRAVALGDFDGDLALDLAVGSPFDDDWVPLPGKGAPQPGYFPFDDVGTVHIFYGNGSLIRTDRRVQLYAQADFTVESGGQSGDNIGAALAAGNFDGDRYTDLAVGAPGETLRDIDLTFGNEIAGVGSVGIFYGKQGGITNSTIPDDFFFEGSPGINATPTSGDGFGSVLTAWNFGKDQALPALLATADLAIGVPSKDVAHPNFSTVVVPNGGLVRVLYGSVDGLSAIASSTTFADQEWRQGVAGVPDLPESEDRFGEVLY